MTSKHYKSIDCRADQSLPIEWLTRVTISLGHFLSAFGASGIATLFQLFAISAMPARTRYPIRGYRFALTSGSDALLSAVRIGIPLANRSQNPSNVMPR